MQKFLKTFKDKIYIDVILSLLLGGIFFCILFGVKILNPFSVDWILQKPFGDVPQAYLGWLMFKDANWNIIPGLFDTVSYPNYISVIYTDSVPIIAMFLKILNSFYKLPDIQYIGMWSMSCFSLQCMITVLLTRKYISSLFLRLICGLLACLMPAIIYRLFMHPSLQAQWLILLTLIPFVYFDNFKKCKVKNLLFYFIVGFLCVNIHIYFVIHLLIVFIAYFVYDWLKQKKYNVILYLISFMLGVTSAFFILGGFYSYSLYREVESPLHWSMNLNAFFNSMGVSSIFSPLPLANQAQYEGFQYLGFGIWMLIIIFCICYIINLIKFKKTYKNEIIFLLVVAMLSLILSILPDITWGEKTIISLENNWIVDEYRRVFRSCGRFGWSLAYTLFIFCFFVFSKINLHKKTNFLIFVLLGSFILQIYDLKNWLIIKRNFAQLENGYKMDFSNKYKNLKKNSYFKHVYVDVSTKYNPEEFYKVAYWAHNNNLTLNNFYLARILKVEYCTPDYTSLDTIFIFNSNNLEDINRFKYSYETEIGTFTANVPIDWDI